MNAALIALKLLPVVFSWLHMAESAMPQKGAGASKLALVLETAGHYLAAVPALASRAEEIKAAIVPHVSTAVSLLNAFGWGRAAQTVQAVTEIASRAVDTIAAVAPAIAAADVSSSPAAPAAEGDAPKPASHWDAPVAPAGNVDENRIG